MTREYPRGNIFSFQRLEKGKIAKLEDFECLSKGGDPSYIQTNKNYPDSF